MERASFAGLERMRSRQGRGWHVVLKSRGTSKAFAGGLSPCRDHAVMAVDRAGRQPPPNSRRPREDPRRPPLSCSEGDSAKVVRTASKSSGRSASDMCRIATAAVLTRRRRFAKGFWPADAQRCATSKRELAPRRTGATSINRAAKLMTSPSDDAPRSAASMLFDTSGRHATSRSHGCGERRRV